MMLIDVPPRVIASRRKHYLVKRGILIRVSECPATSR